MNIKLGASIFLAIAISYVSGCGFFGFENYEEKSFERAIYVSVTTRSHFRAYLEFVKYAIRGNDQKKSMRLGPLILQIEKPCGGNSAQPRMVFSRQIPESLVDNPPQPLSDRVKLDYQLGDSGVFYAKRIVAFTPWSISRQTKQFMAELKCSKKNIKDTWFYVVYNSPIPFGYAEVRVQKGSAYSVKRSRCPPDDSDIQELCKADSGYSCPSMTFGEKDGFEVRNISMFVVTGEPTPGKNCSFDSARYSQYLGNHYYFMGNNTESMKMPRTIPVMTKAIRVVHNSDPCKKKYQMLFYVDKKKLNITQLPCPTQAGVLLQQVKHMQIYVKTLNGNPDTDMSQAKDMFTKELDSKNMTYVKDSHYIAQYRGHGPVFGRTLELWVEKTVPEIVTVCQGSKDGHKTTPLSTEAPTTTTAAAPDTTTMKIIMVTYELA